MIEKHSKNPELDAFLVLLGEFYTSCGKPSYRNLEETSHRLAKRYKDPRHGQRDLPALSSTAVCEILAGRRKGFPKAGWVAMFILCCQRLAWEAGVIAEDPGTRSLPGWQARLQAAQAHTASKIRQATDRPAPVAPSSADAAPADQSAKSAQLLPEGSADACQAKTVRLLPASQHDYVASYGSHGLRLLADLQAKVPDAAYRVAVLLGSGPAHRDHAMALLIQAAASGHAKALDLLEASPKHLDRQKIADHAYELAQAARAERSSPAKAIAYYECAARCGLPDAAIKLAVALLAKGEDDKATRWLEVVADQWDTDAELLMAGLRRSDRLPPV